MGKSGCMECSNEKKRNTNLKNLGVKNPGQCEDVKEKMKDTNMENWGVEYPMQNPEILERAMKQKFQGYRVQNGIFLTIFHCLSRNKQRALFFHF